VASLVYHIDLWIGEDIDQSAIATDAKFVYDRLATVQNMKVSRCEIDCSEGTLTVELTIST
jgi:hypothetical protein